MNVATATADHQVTLAVVAMLVPLVGALVYLARRTNIAADQATQANQAVNNVGPGAHSLFDQISFMRDDIQELREAHQDFARRGWPTLPDDIGTASKLTETIRQIQHEQRHLLAEVQALSDRLIEHDRWERETKYRIDGDGRSPNDPTGSG